MSKHFLLIKEVDVKKMTAMNNFLVTGFPALTSFAGFSECVKLEIQKIINKPIHNTKFSIIVHDYHFHNNIEKHVRYMKSEKPTAELNPPSFKVEYKCDAVISCIISFEITEDMFEDNYELIRNNYTQIKDVIHCLRIAGGIIQNDNNFVDLLENESSLIKELSKLKNGYFIKCADDLMEKYTQEFKGDALKAIIHALEIFMDVSEVSNKYKRRQKGWVSATNVGYQYLTEPLIKKGTRESIPMRYAEPITSLIQYKNSKIIILNLLSEKTSFEKEKISFKSESNDIEYRIKSIQEK